MTQIDLDTGTIYAYRGMTCLAVSPDTVLDLEGMRDQYTVAVDDQIVMLYSQGTKGWVDRMTASLLSTAAQLRTTRTSLSKRTAHLEQLGEALLEEAISREWCSEYEDFAREWGLPYTKTWEVTMSVTVEARSADLAEEEVARNIALSSNMISGPHYDVHESE